MTAADHEQYKALPDSQSQANIAYTVLRANEEISERFSSAEVVAMAQVHATLAVWAELKRFNDRHEADQPNWRPGDV